MARAVFVGIAASPGMGIGRALLVAGRPCDRSATASDAGGVARTDAAIEAGRLRDAVEATATELEGLAARTAPVAGQEVAAILEAQAVMVRDPALLRPAMAAVTSGVPADDAVLAAATAQAKTLAALDDPYFRARAADVLDVGRRIASRLADRHETRLWHADGTLAVIVTDDLAPSETATLRGDRVAGLALTGGAITGHAAIVARALGLPLVLGLGDAVLGLAPDSVVAVDGSGGRVLLEPDEDEIRALTSAAETTARELRST